MTHLYLNSGLEEDEGDLNVAEITAVVRATEKEDWVNGITNNPGEGQINYVDCGYLAGLFRFYNYTASSMAYLEMVVPEEEKGESYPLPATKGTTLEPMYGANYFSRNSSKFGLAGLLGIALTAIV